MLPSGQGPACPLGTRQDSTSWARAFPAQPLSLGAMPDPHGSCWEFAAAQCSCPGCSMSGHLTRPNLSVFSNDRDNSTYPPAFPDGAET